MAAKITTKGDGSNLVETTHESGQTVRQWVEAHSDALTPAAVNGVNQLQTCWPIAGSSEEPCIVTNRNSGESDELFRNRHVLAYVAEMQKPGMGPDPG